MFWYLGLVKFWCSYCNSKAHILVWYFILFSITNLTIQNWFWNSVNNLEWTPVIVLFLASPFKDDNLMTPSPLCFDHITRITYFCRVITYLVLPFPTHFGWVKEDGKGRIFQFSPYLQMILDLNLLNGNIFPNYYYTKELKFCIRCFYWGL